MNLMLFSGAFHVVSDPFRRPQDLYASIISPIGSFVDKAKVILIMSDNIKHCIVCYFVMLYVSLLGCV